MAKARSGCLEHEAKADGSSGDLREEGVDGAEEDEEEFVVVNQKKERLS